MGYSTSEAADALPGRHLGVQRHRRLAGLAAPQRPGAGRAGVRNLGDGALEVAGGANTWTGMALDTERGLLFAPTGSATPDFYGASRGGDNL